MAYDFSQEKQTVLRMVAKNDRGDYIRVAEIIKPDGDKAIDVREFYTPESGDGTLPTKRGLRIPSDCLVDVATSIIKGMTDLQQQMLLENVAEVLGIELVDGEDDSEDNGSDDE